MADLLNFPLIRPALEYLSNNLPSSPAPTAEEIMGSIRSLSAGMRQTPRVFEPLGFRIEQRSLAPAMEVIEDEFLVVTTEDWSRVRSPGRARRRRVKHRQNITVKSEPDTKAYLIGDKIVCHPEFAKALRDRARRTMEGAMDKMFCDIMRGANG